MAAVARSKLFVGSSSEGLGVARAVRQQLKDVAEITLWSDGLFGLGSGTLESLVQSLPNFDFAVLVVTADDLTMTRGKEQASPRDNVIFEAGLFMGRLGRFRTFLVYDSSAQAKLPSDFAGITLAQFLRRSDGNLRAAVGEATDDSRDNRTRSILSFRLSICGGNGCAPSCRSQPLLRCSVNSGLGIHPVSTNQFWLNSATVTGPGEWQAKLTVGTVSSSSGKEYELRAFLNPPVSRPFRNPYSYWPLALASTPAIKVRRQ